MVEKWCIHEEHTKLLITNHKYSTTFENNFGPNHARRNKRLNPRNNSNISSHIRSDYRNVDIKRDNITYQLGYTNVAICVLCSMTYSTCQLIQNKKKDY